MTASSWPHSSYRPRAARIAEPNSADRVLTFRNVHNGLASGMDDTKVVFQKMHDVAQPGGNEGPGRAPRAPPGQFTGRLWSKRGYVVKQLGGGGSGRGGWFETGPRRAAPSTPEPARSGGPSHGVWSLPPACVAARKTELAIWDGESDRMNVVVR